MKRLLLSALFTALFACSAAGQTLQLPPTATAGSGLSIPTSGSGSATLYVFGPATAIKKTVQLGQPVQLEGDQVKAAGRYTVVLKGGDNATGTFFVVPDKVSDIAFLARPSRVPASSPDAISGSAFLFDTNDNLVLTPTPVKFELTVAGGAPVTRTETSKNGIAWVRLGSGKKAGAAQFVVTAGSGDVKRVVLATASDPCNLRMHAAPDKNGDVLLETDPVKDCSGNPVPDGTIVTFSATDATGRSTVDAKLRRGVAKAVLPATQGALLSVASGVVVGNEIKWKGAQ